MKRILLLILVGSLLSILPACKSRKSVIVEEVPDRYKTLEELFDAAEEKHREIAASGQTPSKNDPLAGAEILYYPVSSNERYQLSFIYKNDYCIFYVFSVDGLDDSISRLTVEIPCSDDADIDIVAKQSNAAQAKDGSFYTENPSRYFAPIGSIYYSILFPQSVADPEKERLSITICEKRLP